MNVNGMRFVALPLLAALALSSAALTSAAQAAPRSLGAPAMASPESVGFSSERLERLHALMQQAVDDKKIAGIVTILARHGKIID